MLKIVVPETELFDQSKNEFITLKQQTLMLEHSLVSISKWESKWKVPYLYNDKKTLEQDIDYIRCMTITQNVNPMLYKFLTRDIWEQIYEYINDPMTASNVPDKKSPGVKTKITAETIRYWMIMFNIPVEYEKWHINQLLALIKYCEWKQSDPEKLTPNELYARNSRLNAERKMKLHTKG